MGEDLAQETWLVAAARLREFRGGSRDFSVWLLYLARQQLITYRQAAGLLPTTTLTPDELTDAIDAIDSNMVGDLRVSDVAVEQLLAGLSLTSQEVLLLRVIGGLNAQETGAVIGKSAGAVRVIQHRALRQLASRLADNRTHR
jgi:RNA polymerase sigma-70 factor (ECF subfamily)